MLVRPRLEVYLCTDSSLRTDCGWVFAQHFCNRLGSAYLHLRNVLDETNPAHAEVLNDIKIRFREETFTRESIQQVIHAYPELVCYMSSFLNGGSVQTSVADRFACYT